MRTSNSTTAFAVCCIWSIASSIAVIRFLMSPRSNGVMKVRRTARQHLAGDAVGVILELVDALAEHRRLVAAAQHVLQRQRTLHHRLGVPVKQVKKPAPLWAKRRETSAAWAFSVVQERPPGRPVTELS